MKPLKIVSVLFALGCLVAIACAVTETTHVLRQNQARVKLKEDQALVQQFINASASEMASDKMALKWGLGGVTQEQIDEEDRVVHERVQALAKRVVDDEIEASR
jgi:hypothetical protein